MTTISSAITAYNALSNSISGEKLAITSATGGGAGDAAAAGTDFASVLQNTAKESISTMRTAETESAAAIAGKADIREVVQAITNAELTLKTVVNVRDKVIGAYNDIIRMPV